ncbi:MAG TPA: hypothetical protein VF796_13880 [Humisphaera sp.]
MTDYSLTTLRRIASLLHDAVLLDVAWDRAARTVALRFDCLRRNPDGSDLDDRTVVFRLDGVCAVAVGYDSVFPEARPSSFEPPGRLTAEDMNGWPYRRQEATLRVNSAVAEDAMDAARVDWLAGGGPDLRAAASTFCVSFEQWGDLGLPMIRVWLLAGGDRFAIHDGGDGLPLDLDLWERQFEGWWTGWRAYWASRSNAGVGVDDGSVDELETAIPAGAPEPPDLGYRPPAEPPFDVGPTDTPPDLLRPIRDWFEGHHATDWRRVALAYPAPDDTPDERAALLEDWKTGHDFGRWGYARGIDRWWAEGRRACVFVRGVEHTSPSDGEPAEDRESVWTIALRHRGGGWVIDTYSQGWPAFGSAEDLPAD